MGAVESILQGLTLCRDYTLVIIVNVPCYVSGWSRCWAENVLRVSEGFFLFSFHCKQIVALDRKGKLHNPSPD